MYRYFSLFFKDMCSYSTQAQIYENQDIREGCLQSLIYSTQDRAVYWSRSMGQNESAVRRHCPGRATPSVTPEISTESVTFPPCSSQSLSSLPQIIINITFFLVCYHGYIVVLFRDSTSISTTNNICTIIILSRVVVSNHWLPHEQSG